MVSEFRAAPVAVTEPETETSMSIKGGKGSRMTVEAQYEDSLQLQPRALKVPVSDG